MAHTARLGTFRLNTSLLGLVDPEFFIFINGVDQTNGGVVLESLVIERRQDAPTRVTFDTVGLAVTEGQEVVIRDSGSGTNLQAGRIIARTRVITVQQVYGPRDNERVRDRVVSNDWWFLDRFDRVTKVYESQPANSIVADIIANYTDGGYGVGQVDDTLGPIAATFTYALVSEAIQRIAHAVGAHFCVDPQHQHVCIRTAIVDGHAITLDEAATDYWAFRYRTDLSQIRTRVIVEGTSTRLSAPLSSGDVTVFVDEVQKFDPGGGLARLRDQQFNYDGTDEVTSSLTGVFNLVTDGATGDEVAVIVQDDDVAAQTALATVLGGGASGIVTHYVKDAALSLSEATALAEEDLALFSAVVPTIGYATRSRFALPGKTVTVSRTNPRTIAKAATITQVTSTTRGVPAVGNLYLQHDVTASPDETTLTDVLKTTTE